MNLITLFIFAVLSLHPVLAEGRVLTDMRGMEVVIPDDPKRIATIDDGFVEGVMTHLGVIERVKVIGSWAMKRDYRYRFESVSGEIWEHRGLHTMKFLHPWLDELPCVVSPQGNMLNIEALAASSPDLVFLRVGDTSVGTASDKVQKAIDAIEGLGLPLLVLYSPSWFGRGDLSGMEAEAALIGEAFGLRDKAVDFARYLAETERMIRERTAAVPASERPSILFLGLRPDVRSKGAVGTVHGADTPESYIIEQVVGARNAYRGPGRAVPMGVEQIYACDPDIVILPTASGYHPPRELYEAPYCTPLHELRAVKARRVYAMPWTPMNASRRVEYPLEMLIIAKAAYPDLFRDFSVYEFALEFYQKAYGVDEYTARALRTTQLLDWMDDTGF